MPDALKTADITRRFFNARVPLIVVRSIEPSRVLGILRSLAMELRSMAFFQYSRTEGLLEVTREQPVLEDHSLTSTLEYAQHTFKARSNVNFIFTDLEDLENDSPTSRHFAQMARLAEQYQGSIILVVDKPVWSGLSRLGMTVELDLPHVEELYETINQLIDAHRSIVPIEWQYNEIHRAAEMLSGITEAEATNVLAAMIAKGSIYNADITELSQFKDQIFGELTGIEKINLRDTYQTGGLQNLKSWLKKREALMKADLSHTSLHPPKGVLLCGVPGCGKSLSAKVIAYQWQLPLYRLDIASVMGMYVGESESNLREALAAADRVAPCVLWVDEIEKGLATSSADSSVTKRLIGQFLFWLQESTSKVFMVATANDVTTLPPELLRKGRFDEIFFVDLPSEEERCEILQLCFNKYTRTPVSDTLLADLIQLSEGFAGSDIDAVVHDIASDMFSKQTNILPDDGYIRDLFSNVMPFSKSNPEEVAAIRSWGENRAVPAGVGATTPSFATSVSTPRRRQVIV